jgi:hypothetical protein
MNFGLSPRFMANFTKLATVTFVWQGSRLAGIDPSLDFHDDGTLSRDVVIAAISPRSIS